jgi:predicted TIM-barrel fold metal-dependent hydrolase
MTATRIIDAHHHLWDLTAHHYPWLSGPMHDRGWGDWSALRRNYLIPDFLDDTRNQNLQKSVHVQANYDPANPVGETLWLEYLAGQPGSAGIPHGIVAYANLADPGAEGILEAHARYPRVRGIRQVLNRHADPQRNRADRDYLADESWLSNFGLLRKHGFSFDVQVYFQQMPAVAALATRYPDIQFILDHAGMPAERDAAGIEGWRAGMRLLARLPNMAVKLCGYGMVDVHWTPESMRPFVLEPIEMFGTGRCMFASNFPVDKLMSDYDRLWNTYRQITVDLSDSERDALFYGNAERIYRL